MQTLRTPRSVSIFNEALSLLQANVAELALGKTSPEDLLYSVYRASANERTAHDRARTVSLAMIGFEVVIPELKAGSAPDSSKPQRCHMTYLVDSDREAFTAAEITNDRIMAAKQWGLSRHNAAVRKPIAITKSEREDRISRLQGLIHNEDCGIAAAQTRIDRRNESIAKLEARIAEERRKNAADEDLIARHQDSRTKHVSKMSDLKSQREK